MLIYKYYSFVSCFTIETAVLCEFLPLFLHHPNLGLTEFPTDQQNLQSHLLWNGSIK